MVVSPRPPAGVRMRGKKPARSVSGALKPSRLIREGFCRQVSQTLTVRRTPTRGRAGDGKKEREGPGERSRNAMEGKRLGDLLRDLESLEVANGGDVPIAGITNDSRRVRPGFLFVCVRGFKDDGHRYVPEA
ncbi:MAG TPA: Mur ligase domain-containing protein, partial [Candidatus Methylomirabilis sp.]